MSSPSKPTTTLPRNLQYNVGLVGADCRRDATNQHYGELEFPSIRSQSQKSLSGRYSSKLVKLIQKKNGAGIKAAGIGGLMYDGWTKYFHTLHWDVGGVYSSRANEESQKNQEFGSIKILADLHPTFTTRHIGVAS